jgi:DNA-binding NarL/FixJ family response regulator
MTSVVIVDDQELIRTGFRLILDLEPDIEVVGQAADGDEALRVVAESRPDVALLDIRMPRLDGIDVTRRIVAARSRTRVLIMTTFDLDEYVFSALRAGASGFLLKDVPRAQLVDAVHIVAGGDALLSPRVTTRLIERFVREPTEHPTGPISSLTEREREVLRAIADGMTNHEIAERLIVSDATIKTHVARLLAKLGVRDRVQAVVLGYETGFLRVGER